MVERERDFHAVALQSCGRGGVHSFDLLRLQLHSDIKTVSKQMQQEEEEEAREAEANEAGG